MHACNWYTARTYCLVRWVSREYFLSLYVLKHSDSGGVWNPRNSFKNLPSELVESNRLQWGMDMLWINNRHDRCQPHAAASHRPFLFISRPQFEARIAQSLRHNLVQLSSSEIHACSCPNGAVVLSSKPDFSSYSPAELQQMTYFYKKTRFGLSVSTEIKKVKPNFAKPEVLPKESHYRHWQKHEMMFAKDNRERAHICPLDIMQYCDGF